MLLILVVETIFSKNRHHAFKYLHLWRTILSELFIFVAWKILLKIKQNYVLGKIFRSRTNGRQRKFLPRLVVQMCSRASKMGKSRRSYVNIYDKDFHVQAFLKHIAIWCRYNQGSSSLESRWSIKFFCRFSAKDFVFHQSPAVASTIAHTKEVLIRFY